MDTYTERVRRFKEFPEMAKKHGISYGKRVGRESKFAEILETSYGGSGVDDMVLKVMPVYAGEGKVLNWNYCNVKKEQRLVKQMASNIDKTPHFPLVYDTFYDEDNHHPYGNEHLSTAPENAVVMIAERAKGDLFDWMKEERTEMEWKVTIMQLLMGFAASQSLFGLWHDDAHGGNFLYFESGEKVEDSGR